MASIGKEKIGVKIVFNEKDPITGKAKNSSLQINDIKAQASDDDIYEVAKAIGQMHGAELKDIMKIHNTYLQA